MRSRIFRSIIAVAMAVLIAGICIASSFLYGYFNRTQEKQLASELALVASRVDEVGVEYFEYFDSTIFRFTLVSSDGKVLYDSDVDIKNMENHSQREEIAQALESGWGSSARYSNTLMAQTYYEAMRLSDGSVLRISSSQKTVGALLFDMLPAIGIIVVISVVLSLFLSHKMTKSIIRPLEGIDLDNPSEDIAYEELKPIVTKIKKQHKQISQQLMQLRQKSDEFALITSSMNEGLILLDGQGIIISINTAAKGLFNMDSRALGSDFLSINKSPELAEAIKRAMEGKHSEYHEQRNGREYQFIINRTESRGETVGVVILCLDVTEAAFAERNRREFTANVSHELKTPLQSIIGSAELLENRLVKPEDTDRFVGNIKNEATRLVSLINDIIHLSQLDEGTAPAKETVDLYAVAGEVVDVLWASAREKNISISLEGESCLVSGIRRYIYEIIYNLCDNAIRYNKEGGSVKVTLEKKGQGCRLQVSDTGIGIPAEHRSRIFERFYRVDKSHSRQTGGTGLGLSIVKHAAAYHNAAITLESEEGKGTTVSVNFQ